MSGNDDVTIFMELLKHQKMHGKLVLVFSLNIKFALHSINEFKRNKILTLLVARSISTEEKKKNCWGKKKNSLEDGQFIVISPNDF